MANHDKIERLLRQRLEASYDEDRTRWREALAGAQGSSRVVTNDASLVSSDGTTVNTTVYQVNVTTGDVLIAGLFGTIGALSDQDLLADVVAYDLDGAAPAAIGDGNSCVFAMLAVLVDDAPELVFIQGAEVASGGEAAPTPEECLTALRKAAPSNYVDSGLGIYLGTITVARDDGGAGVTLTHSDPSADDDIKGKRLAGALAS